MTRQRIDWDAAHRGVERGAQALAAGGEPDARRRDDVLRRRAAALAARGRQANAGATTATAVLTFLSAGERYALPLTALAAVVRGRPLGPVPGAQRSVVGTLYERADIWMIHDLRILLDLDSGATGTSGFFLLLRGPRRRAGLLVEGLGGVDRVDISRLAAATAPSAAPPRLVLGLTADAVAVLDETGLCSHPALTEVT